MVELVEESLREKIVFGDVVAELLKAANFIKNIFSHETRHSSHAVYADQVDEQIHTTVTCSEIDLL